jgi:glycerol-1-phosphate dehydrogenase [NAD(P)+]
VSVALPASAAEAARNLDLIRAQLAGTADAPLLKPLGLGGVVLGAGALAQVPALVAELRDGSTGEIAVLADCRPMAGRDDEVKSGLVRALSNGCAVRRVTIGDANARVHADAATIEDASAQTSGAGVLVSVGSGTVVDVGKAVAARSNGIPHIAVQTAGSVNGFADDQSVLLVDGVKRTTQASWPDRLVVDIDVVARAPAELNRAGLGDLLASYTAPADWLLAGLVEQDDSYSPAVVGLTRTYVDPAVDAAAGIGSGVPQAIEELVGALTLSGIAMGVAGRTSPGSGMEHTVSHLLEMSQTPENDEPLHGAKVGALSVIASLLWERVRAEVRDGGLTRLRFPSADEMRSRVYDAFGHLGASDATAGECWRDYQAKLARWHAAAPALRTLDARWTAAEQELDAILVPAARLVTALRDSGAPTRMSELGVEPDRLRWALTNCHLMRDRFTVADLAFFLGIYEPGHVDRLLAEAASIGAGA